VVWEEVVKTDATEHLLGMVEWVVVLGFLEFEGVSIVDVLELL